MLAFLSINEKVTSMDQRFHVSDETMSVINVTERKLNDTGSAVKTNRFSPLNCVFLNGAFSKVAKVGHVADAQTSEKFQFAISNLTAKMSSIRPVRRCLPIFLSYNLQIPNVVSNFKCLINILLIISSCSSLYIQNSVTQVISLINNEQGS
ncbi:hypothetical protein QJS04_geneDACA012977 [Acorus gramineus]|uniref:Uncharacterized protein n=1 Tax=Acorus gramineus TaxID=55184 RepID=A0AAV9B7B0_ACOGR|nr:hypothetical protein QJS04_geneDACA012977 [Acorus gramineus]